MFCFQCEETLDSTGCVKSGVCGKTEEVSNLQDLLIYNLKGISYWMSKTKTAGEKIDDKDYLFLLQGLFTTVTNVNFDSERMVVLLNESLNIRNKYMVKFKNHISAIQVSGVANRSTSTFIVDCAVWEPEDRNIVNYNKKAETVGIKNPTDDIVSLSELLMYGLKGAAAYAYHAYVLNYTDISINDFIVKALSYLANQEELNADILLDLVFECGKVGVDVMALLDKANTTHYGEPVPTKVTNGTKKGKSILISGHDLLELEELLKQTQGKNVNVYTHGEMLPAHAYPYFKQFSNFIGNYGGAWWEQQGEFSDFAGPIVMTTNCIQKPLYNYANRIFTTDMVAMPGVKHVYNHDFSDVIKTALESEDALENIKGEIDTGFARNTLVNSAEAILNLVQAGKIKNFVVMAGCDSNDKERSYYSNLAKALPEDSLILTAGCAKYRYNRLGLGDIEGLPRVIDAGQCNDSYSLVVAALKLKEVLKLNDINDLPIFYEIAWYEQKAVLVLLALLYLGVKNIRLGYKLPAFLTPNIANTLMEKFNIMGVSSIEESLRYIGGDAGGCYIAGSGPFGNAIDSSGNVWVENGGNGTPGTAAGYSNVQEYMGTANVPEYFSYS
jgi:hydroxylamine reductase